MRRLRLHSSTRLSLVLLLLHTIITCPNVVQAALIPVISNNTMTLRNATLIQPSPQNRVAEAAKAAIVDLRPADPSTFSQRAVITLSGIADHAKSVFEILFHLPSSLSNGATVTVVDMFSDFEIDEDISYNEHGVMRKTLNKTLVKQVTVRPMMHSSSEEDEEEVEDTESDVADNGFPTSVADGARVTVRSNILPNGDGGDFDAGSSDLSLDDSSDTGFRSSRPTRYSPASSLSYYSPPSPPSSSSSTQTQGTVRAAANIQLETASFESESASSSSSASASASSTASTVSEDDEITSSLSTNSLLGSSEDETDGLPLGNGVPSLSLAASQLSPSRESSEVSTMTNPQDSTDESNNDQSTTTETKSLLSLSSSIHTLGDNTKQLSDMVYKIVKNEQVNSLAAIPCRTVSNWLPDVLRMILASNPTLEFFCIDTDTSVESMEDLKDAYSKMPKSTFIKSEVQELGGKLPEGIELVLSWAGIQQWGIMKSWTFVKQLKKKSVTFCLMSNNAVAKNGDDEIGVINVRKAPLLFNEPKRIIGKVSEDVTKQLLLYDLKTVRDDW